MLRDFAFFPLYLATLRVAAQLMDGIFIVFGLFLLVGGWGQPLVLIYGALILGFAVTNLNAIELARLAFKAKRLHGHRLRAHTFNVALPSAYYIGLLEMGPSGPIQWSWVAPIILPSLLNWLAIERTLQFNRALLSDSR